jgi:predicted nucleotidyltransferase
MNHLIGHIRALHLRLEPGSWALIGGIAVSLRVQPRFTSDIDVAVIVNDDPTAEALVMRLSGLGYRAVAVVEQKATGRLSTVRLLPPGEGENGAVADLLFASSGIEAELVRAAEHLKILPDLIVPVARIGHLIALKALARDDRTRPQDWVDLVHLLAEATPEDLALAREGARLIVERGYHRGRELEAELEVLIGELAGPRGPAV